MVSRWLDTREERAWRSYRRMFTLLEGRLAQELTASTGLSMADYTVLSNIVEIEGRRWRITALAEHMQWSQSRLSHQIRRMEDRGLVRREQVDADARGAHVTITDAGLRALRQAAPAHFAGVRKHLIDVLSPSEIDTLGDIAERVVSRLQAVEDPA